MSGGGQLWSEAARRGAACALLLTLPALAAGCEAGRDARAARRTVDDTEVAAVTAEERSAVFPPRPWGAQADEAVRAFAETVAACMHRHGYDYESTPQAQVRLAGEGAGAPLTADLLDTLDPADWLRHARRWGYGYAAAHRLTVAEQALPPAPDPNLDREQALDAQERRAYYVVLYGPAFPDGQPLDPDHLFPPDDPEAGCHGEAVAVHRPLSLLPEDARQGLAELDAPAGAVDEARERWATCMRERGFEVSSRIEAIQQAAGGEGVAVADGGGRGAEGWQEVEVHRGEETFVVALPPLDEDALAGEQRLATADAECDAGTGLARTLRQVREQRQSVFIARWRPELTEAGLLPPARGG